MNNRCKYCGLTNAIEGGSCSDSPTKGHIVNDVAYLASYVFTPVVINIGLLARKMFNLWSSRK